MKLNFAICATIVALGAYVTSSQASEKVFIYRYVITETGMFSSLDPLDADMTSNLPVARMVYATPLETSDNNQITSRVLESFRFNSDNRTIEWVVKTGLKFEDGTTITPDDVAFAVARMAYARPKFPVLSSIAGVAEWSKSNDALKEYPKGIKVDGQKISIQLSETVKHPLFRFCLELFSIIPRRCVDPKTNKISCKSIPESGPYKFEAKTSDTVSFARRPNEIDVSIPQKIEFKYLATTDVPKRIGQFDSRTVVAGSEADYTSDALKGLETSLKVAFMPASRFEALLINKEVPPFGDKVCRQIFMQKFRTAFQAIANGRVSEGSIFTKILPGYQSLEAMQSAVKVESKEIAECKKKFLGTVIPWGFDEGHRDSTFVKAITSALTELGVTASKPLAVSTRKEFTDSFAGGKIAFYNAGSGFWALDPVGDLKMLFTPNLHKPLKQLWSDPKFLELLAGVGEDAASFKALNTYLFDESLLNVYGHQRRFFAAKNSSLFRELNFAITSPAPWQVFKVQ
jgi:hypothetical protein